MGDGEDVFQAARGVHGAVADRRPRAPSDEKDAGRSTRPTSTTAKANVDYAAIGLWDDGPCDKAKPKLEIGLMTVFESPVVSLKDQATALEASADGVQRAGWRQRLVHRGPHL